MKDLAAAYIAIPICSFIVLSAIKDWDWLMNSGKSAMIIKLIGRKGARAFYIFFGSLVITIFTLKLTGVVE